jgi:hypothetical protein
LDIDVVGFAFRAFVCDHGEDGEGFSGRVGFAGAGVVTLELPAAAASLEGEGFEELVGRGECHG